MSCMSGSPNLNSFRDRGQVAVQLVSCGVLLPGLVQPKQQYIYISFYIFIYIYIYIYIYILLHRHCNAVYNQSTIDRETKECIFPSSKKCDLRIAKNYRGMTETESYQPRRTNTTIETTFREFSLKRFES